MARKTTKTTKTTKSRKSSKKTKTDPNRPHAISAKFIIISFLVLILLGFIVMAYLFFDSDHQYQSYYEVRDQNALYLIENQNQITQQIHENQLDPHEVAHIFIPESPAHYVDIQHIPQHDVPYINQNDPRWRDEPYGTDGSRTIWENGCAIVVLAMVDSYFQGSFTRPESIAQWAGGQYYLDLQGTSWSIYENFGLEYGYQVEDLGNDFNQAMNYVNQNYLIVVSVGPGSFTDGGHVMLIRGYEDGLVYLNDPNDAPSKFFSIQGIPAQTVIDDALNYWAITPL